MSDTSIGNGRGKSDLAAVRSDIDALKADLGALLKHVKSGTVDGVTGEAKRLYGKLSNQGDETLESLARQVEEKPVASLLIAFGIGFVAGRILSR
jgi:hypothetical protein